MHFEEINEFGIYRTPLTQTMERPVWEPPDIDVIGRFETPTNTYFLEHIEEVIPDPALRCEYIS